MIILNAFISSLLQQELYVAARLISSYSDSWAFLFLDLMHQLLTNFLFATAAAESQRCYHMPN